MSEGADSVAQVCENSLTNIEDDPELLPPRTISHTTRRPRFGTGNVPLSPYILIDGRKLRSALALSKKRPLRRVSFPANHNLLVTGYLEPTNPWKHAENVNRDDLISAYKESCEKHNTDPLEIVISQLEGLDISQKYSDEFKLKGQILDPNQCESLEEIFKRIQFSKIDLEATSLNDESSVILFDMLEYYESTKHLNISSNPGIGLHGWQACANMIRKTQCLEHLHAKGVILNEQYMNILSRALRLVCHLHVLKLENCGLSGRSIVTLVAALKMNKGLRELYLADNGLDFYDAIQLGSLLRSNNHLQLLDISNNNIQDNGVRDILEGLINQINEDKDGTGLNILVLWNNQLTKESSPYFARIIALSKTIETLNIGKNMLTNELLFIIKDALKKNRVLLQLGMQSIDLTCDGILALSEIIKINQILQRIDLRNNDVQITGMKALSSAMKENKSITKIDLDENPRFTKVDNVSETLRQYMQFVAEIQVCCSQNEQNHIIEGISEGSESSHHNSLCSTNSRKISLTCQTLPCSLPTMISIQSDESERSFPEPKRINGGRLRSPALSPSSSPITSPVPAPSRSRFVVSRVPEALRSTELTAPLSSAASLSPKLPFTHLTSTASGSSRFRVSVVESASIKPLPKPVVASSEAAVTPDLNFKASRVESTDSDDSDNVLNLEKDNDQNVTDFHNVVSSNVSRSILNEKETCTSSVHDDFGATATATLKTQPVDDRNFITSEKTVYDDAEHSRIDASTYLQNITPMKHIKRTENCYHGDTKNLKTHVNTNSDDNGSEASAATDKLVIISKEHTEATPSNIFLNESTRLQNSDSEKLSAPFQRSTDIASASELQYTSTFQDSTTSGITNEYKFHCYSKEDKDVIRNSEKHELSVPLKTRATKSVAIFQLLNFKSLRNVFSLSKFMLNLNVSEQRGKSYPKIVTQMDLLLNRNCTTDIVDVQQEHASHSNEKELIVKRERQKDSVVSLSSNQSLLQDTLLNNYVVLFNKNTVLMANHVASNLVGNSCFRCINNILLIPGSKREMPLVKFITVHDYSNLKITENYIRNDNIREILNEVGLILIKRICDETLTNSINFISDNSSLFYSIMYDIINASDVLTVNTFDRLRDFLILNLNGENDNFISSADNKQSSLVRLICNKRPNCSVHNKSFVYHNALKINVTTNCLNDKVTRIYHIDDNSGKKAFRDIHDMLRNKLDGIDNYYNSRDTPFSNPMDWHAISVNNVPEVRRVIKINFVHKDINTELNDDDMDLCTSVVYLNDVVDTSKIQMIVKKCTIEDNEYFDASNVIKTKSNDSITNATDSTTESVDVLLSKTHPCKAVFNTFVPKNIIFSVAGNSIDETLDERKFLSENISNDWSNDTMELNTSSYDLPQIPDSSIKLLINEPETIHKDSAASRHRNENFPLNHNIQKSAHLHDNQTFQEDDQPEIDSEYFRMYRNARSIPNSKRDLCLLDKDSVVRDDSSENMYIFTKFESNIAQHVKCTTSDAICDVTHKYFNTIKCAVATTICSKGKVNARDDMRIEIISDKNTNVVKSSSVIRKTSTK